RRGWVRVTIHGASNLVPVDLDEPLVADAEMMRDLVEHDASDLPAQQLGIVAVESPERAAVDRDLVRERTAVAGAPSGQGHALIEAEQRLTLRRFVLDDDLDV